MGCAAVHLSPPSMRLRVRRDRNLPFAITLTDSRQLRKVAVCDNLILIQFSTQKNATKHGSNLRTHLILLKRNFVAVREVLVEILPPTQSAVKRKEILLTVGEHSESQNRLKHVCLSFLSSFHLKLFFLAFC